jgi:hypothetical protein
MGRGVQLAGVPQAAVADRGAVLRRILADLPDPLLAALVSGLDLYGDNLCAGRLYHSHTSSCAAGAMIRQLNPAEFEGGRLRFLVRHRWRKYAASYGGELRAGMHAAMSESTFDRAVAVTVAAVPGCRLRDASRVVGRWFLDEAEREMHIRDDRRAAGLPPAVNWRERRLRAWGEDLDRRLAPIELGDGYADSVELSITKR